MQQPAIEEQLIDLSRPERQQTALAPAMTEGEYFEPAMRGEAWAQTKLGKAYVASADDPLRVQQGVQLLRQAAEQNDAEALYVLATLSAAGVGVEQSETNAFEQMKRAAELGWADAQFELATKYFEGGDNGTNDLLATEWLREAAAQGQKTAKLYLGMTLLRSADEQENAEGEKILRQAAANGDSKAAAFLAAAKARGDFGMTKDEHAAEALLLPFAKNGDPESQFLLASLYWQGSQITDKRDLAEYWLKKSAASGHTEAAATLKTQEIFFAPDQK